MTFSQKKRCKGPSRAKPAKASKQSLCTVSCSPWPIENMRSVLYHQGLCLPCLCFFEKQKFIIGRRDRIGLLCVLFDRETNAIILPVSCAIRSEYWRVIKKIKWQTVYKMFNYKAKERMFQKHLHSVRSDRLFECQGWQEHRLQTTLVLGQI